MKVISLPQPNALFVAHGYQTIVTREYDTKHRGWVAIHATNDTPDIDNLPVWPYVDVVHRVDDERHAKGWSVFGTNGVNAFDVLPRGCIIGVAWLAKTERTDGITERWNRREHDWRLDDPDYADVPAWEPTFSDFTRGRMAWWLTSPAPLIRPIRIDAELTGFGLWDLPEEADVPIAMDIAKQGIVLPDNFDPAFFRKINRRGNTEATRPRNM